MFRALPILIVLLTAMIGAKTLELLEVIPDIITVRAIKAAEEAKPADAKAAETAKKPEAPVPPTKEDPKAKADASSAPVIEDSKTPSDTAPSADKPSEEKVPQTRFTDSEVEILQDLSRRREVLDERERDISLKENSLVVIEKSLDQKITTLKDLQQQLQSVLSQYEVKEEDKIKSLVKVYESMKPQDAAKIFEQLQMSVVIEVSVHMKEAKLAQILAKMDPYKAKEVTMELANRRKIKDIQ